MKCPRCGDWLELEIEEVHRDFPIFWEIHWAYCCECHWKGYVKLHYTVAKEEILSEESDS